MQELYARAAELAGREVEVVDTADRMKIVLFMVIGRSPPPKAHTEQLALEAFIRWAEEFPIVDPPDADLYDDTRPIPKDSPGEF